MSQKTMIGWLVLKKETLNKYILPYFVTHLPQYNQPIQTKIV